MHFANLPLQLFSAHLRSFRFGVAAIAAVGLTVLLAAPNAFGQQVILQDTFGGANGASIASQAPSPTNLPGGTWRVGNGTAKYQSPNTLSFSASNGYIEVPTQSGSYTPPTMLTISASLSIGNANSNGAFSRGMGLGFFASNSYPSTNVGEFDWSGGLCLDCGGNGSNLGEVELDQGLGNTSPNENRLVLCPYNPAAFGGAAFSTSAFYTLSYTINTTTGQISNVSLSNGTYTDTADYASIDSYNTTATGPDGAIFTVANTAYAGLVNSSSGNETELAQNFEISAAAAPASYWTGTAGDSKWATAGNWSGAVPGSTTGTTNTDTALFNQTVSSSPTVIDVGGRNVMNITFDTAAVSSMTIGTTTGPALILTSGGAIQTTSTVANPQVVNAPLQLEGNYAFTSGSSTTTATLSFGGAIKPDSSLTSAPTVLTLNGSNAGANGLNGVLSDNGSAQLALAVQGSNWVLGAANTYSGATGVTAGTLQIGNGTAGSLNAASNISVSGSGALVVAGGGSLSTNGVAISGGSMSVNSGGSVGAATFLLTGGSLTINGGATVGNAAITVNGGTFAALAGSGTLSIGSGGGGSAGATLAVNSGGTFSMVDGAIGTVKLQQGSGFGGSNTALTLGGGTLDFDLSSSGADELEVNVGAASVSGVNTIALTPFGSSLTPGTYPLITAPSGLNAGTFQFAGGSQSTYVSAGSNVYQLTLKNSASAESVTVAHSNFAYIIQDTFGGTSGNSINGQAPSPTNLPGGTWIVGNGSATYQSPNTLAFNASNGYIEVPTQSGSYTAPTTLTISAALSIGAANGNGAFSRGMGLGFFASNSYPSTNVGEFNWSGGLCLDCADGSNSTAGEVELDQGLGNTSPNENRLVSVAYNPAAFGGAPFSTSAFYTLSYTINTTTGQISNVSLSNGTYTDTADYASIDSYNTSGIFTVANTAYAGLVNSSSGFETELASNFTLSGVSSSGIEWDGNGMPGDWADPNNWTGGVVPGAIAANDAAATNTDNVLFDIYNSSNIAPVVNAGRNVQSITFDNSGGNLTGSITLGTATGNKLLLTSGGTIQTTGSVTFPQYVNAPLVLEGGGTYTFVSNSTTSGATLNFGGAITAGTGSMVTLTLAGSTASGANVISGPIGDGTTGGQVSLSVTGATWSLTAANSYSGSTGVAGGSLQIGSGGSLNPASAISVSGSGALVVAGGGSLSTNSIAISGGSMSVGSGGSVGAATVSMTGGSLTVNSGATVGNVAVTVNGGTFAALTGAGTLSIGSSGAGSAGATLAVNFGGTFSMVDGAIGTLNLQQQTSFGAGNTALTLGGGTLDFELSSGGADKLAVNVGAASVSGTNTIAITPLGSSLLTGTYSLITASSGLNGGTFQFAGGSQSTYVSAGANMYQLTLNNSANAETVTVAPSSIANIIQETFGGTNGASISGQAPSPINLPGGTWIIGKGPAVYQTPNTLAFDSSNGYIEVPTQSGSYTPPTSLTISAALSIGSANGQGQYSRGMGLGFFATTSYSNQVGEWNWSGGLCLDCADGSNSTAGEVELDQGTGNGENRLVSVAYNPAAFGGAAFSTSAFYTLSYTINTTTGQISNVSLSNGTYIDTADYASIDSYDTTATGPYGAIFTVANTAYAGLVNSSSGFATELASNFTLSGTVAGNSSYWTGGAGDSTWATAGNWNGAVPGSTTGTTNADTALFNQTVTSSPTVIDVGGRNVMNITFDTAAVSSMIIGTTTGPALILTSGGAIQTTSTVTNPQVVNAPLTLEGNYTFTSGATTSAATLSFGGGITPDASLTSSPTTLMLNGSNTGASTISGALSDNGSAALAVAVSGTGVWVLSGATSAYSGGTTIASGATLQLAGSVSVMSQSMNIANSGSLIVASGTNQKVGTITGSGNIAVNSGSLTAYQILQSSLTIGAAATVTLSPSGSGSIGNPQGPNNTNFSSNVGSLSIAGAMNAWTGTLDIGNNGLVIQYGTGADPFLTIENMVESGYNGGNWGGTGITSSLAQNATGSAHPLNIGLEDFTPNAHGFGASITFEGQTITTSAVLVRLTYMDDLELAGDMLQNDATNDALLFAANYAIGTTWSVGDLTHDGSINSNDALLFAANYGIGFPSLDGTTGNAAALGGAAGVPEPLSILLAALGALGLGLLPRRRRRG